MSRILLLACVVFNAHVLRAEERSPPVYETPAAAYEAYAKARSKGDWKTSWACMTPQLQDLEANEALFQLGMIEPDYEKKYLKPDIKEPAGPPATEQERQKLLLEMIRDKYSVYAAVCVYEAKSLNPIDWKHPLRQVVIDNDRARGIVTRHLFSITRKPGKPEIHERSPYDALVHFQKTDKGWLIDSAR